MRLILPALLTLLYPLLVFLGLSHFEPRYLAVLLLLIALLRAVSSGQRIWLVAALGAALLAGFTLWDNALLPLKLYPVLINGLFLLLFASSLISPPSIIERLARLRIPQLPPKAVHYTRQVTKVWCGFFVLNGSLALATALWASDEVWALYNGLLAYLLMGLLFGVEWCYRQRVQGTSS